MQDEKLLEAIHSMNDYVEKTDKINQRLTSLCKTVIICMLLLGIGLGIVNAYKDYAYFFSDYQYPTVQQKAGTDQLKQSIGKE